MRRFRTYIYIGLKWRQLSGGEATVSGVINETWRRGTEGHVLMGKHGWWVELDDL